MSLKRFITQVQVGRSVVDTIIKLPADEGEKLGLTEYTKAKAKRTPSNKGAKPAANKQEPPASNKGAKPAEVTPESDASKDKTAAADGASDPGASEA